MKEVETRNQLLDIAMELIQLRGYNAFSFRDLAQRLEMRSASIHYHFPTKAHLGVAVVQRHRQLLREVCSQIDAEEQDAWQRLRRYTAVFRSTLANGGRMCLGGTLAHDYSTLPAEVVQETRGFFEDNERWLARTLQDGKKAGTLEFSRSAAEVSRSLFAALEGALLSARAFEDLSRFDAAAHWLLAALKA